MSAHAVWKWCLMMLPAALIGGELTAPITSVTVYDRAALVKRSVEVPLVQGENTFIVGGFPAGMTDSSVSAAVRSPDVRVKGASLEYKFEETATDAECEAAKDALRRAREAADAAQNEMEVWNSELARLQKLSPSVPERKPDGSPRAFDAAAWENILSYSWKTMLEDYRKLRAAQWKNAELRKALTLAEEKYEKLSSREKTMRKNVAVRVDSAKNAKCVLEITYLIPNASWSPAYDIRVDANSNEVKISSYAVLRQTTGEDWINVPILFSTAIPSVSADLPEFRKLLITEKFNAPREDGSSSLGTVLESKRMVAKAPRKMYGDTLRKSKIVEASSSSPRITEDSLRGDKDSFLRETPAKRQSIQQRGEWFNTVQFKDGRTVKIHAALNSDSRGGVTYRSESGRIQHLDLAQVKEISAVSRETQGLDFEPRRLRIPAQYLSGLDYKFPAARPDTVFSDGQYRKISLKTETFQGEKYYYFIPYLSEHAYRKCRVRNPGFIPILAGPARIFHGTEYVGDTDIPTIVAWGAAFSVNIGVDQRVKLERKTERMSENTGLISAYRKTSVRSTATVKNQTPEPVKYEFLERVPVSGMKEITVGAITLNGTEIRKLTVPGRIIKTGVIPPGKEEIIRLSYFIEYPADFVVTHSDGGGNPRPGFGPDIDAASAAK